MRIALRAARKRRPKQAAWIFAPLVSSSIVSASIATLVWTLVTSTAALAKPMAFRESLARGQATQVSSPVQDVEFARYLEQAVDIIRKQILEVPTCRTYFQRHDVDLDAWLAPNEPPYVVARRLATLPWRSTSPICGGAQRHPPFEYLFVDKNCFRGRDVCELASLLMHEMGHLARRDIRDNEPPEFLAVCRLSACVNPARYD